MASSHLPGTKTGIRRPAVLNSAVAGSAASDAIEGPHAIPEGDGDV